MRASTGDERTSELQLMCNPQVDTVVFTGVEQEPGTDRNFYILKGQSKFACRVNPPPPPPPIKCTHTSASGDQYDLGALQAGGPFEVLVAEDPRVSFIHSIGICAQSGPCARAEHPEDPSSCQTTKAGDLQYSNGKLSTLKIEDLTVPFGVQGVLLSYSNKGDRTCASSANPEGERRTVVEIICSATPISPDPILKFVAEGPKCVYNFALESKSACPSSFQNATVV
jgi:hypothetical protein